MLYGGFTLVALMILDWQSGLIVLVCGVPLALLMRWFYRSSQSAYRGTRVHSARVIVKFVETMTGIRAGKAFRTEPRNEVEFGRLAGAYRNANMRVIRLFGTFEPALMAISAFAIGAVVLWGGVRITWESFTVGALLGAVLYVRNFFAPLQEVAMFLNSYQAAATSLEKVSGVLEEQPSVPDPATPSRSHTRAGTCSSTTSRSATAMVERCCQSCVSTSRAARQWPSSARQVRASRLSPSSSRASTTRRRGASRSTASICAT